MKYRVRIVCIPENEGGLIRLRGGFAGFGVNVLRFSSVKLTVPCSKTDGFIAACSSNESTATFDKATAFPRPMTRAGPRLGFMLTFPSTFPFIISGCSAIL